MPAYFLVPEKFTTGPDGKDFRSVNKTSVIVKIMQRKQKLWEEAKKLGQDTITVELLNDDNGSRKKWATLLRKN